MHYLYTGDYQTVKPSSISELRKRAMEYARSVFAYRAAVKYGLDGLAEHAKRYIEIFDKEVSINDIISLGRKAFPEYQKSHGFPSILPIESRQASRQTKGSSNGNSILKCLASQWTLINFLGRLWHKPTLARSLPFDVKPNHAAALIRRQCRTSAERRSRAATVLSV